MAMEVVVVMLVLHGGCRYSSGICGAQGGSSGCNGRDHSWDIMLVEDMIVAVMITTMMMWIMITVIDHSD